MKNYKVSFTLVERNTVTVSPYTGKSYKKSHVRRNWIKLTYYIIADNLGQALKTAKEIAEEQNWELNAVIEKEE